MPRNRENAYDRYRRNFNVQKDCLRKKTAYFIENHESSVEINVLRTEEDIPAVLVFSDKEGADEVYLFVSANDDFQVQDYFTWNSTTFFAFEKVEVVKEVDYIKYKVLQCNVFVNNSFWAYFRSTLRAARDNTLSGHTEISTLIPLLICPRNSQLTIGGTLSFNDQSWDIEDGDIFTLTGIGYYYLSRGLNSRDEEEWEPEDDYVENTVYIGEEVKLDTENGYCMPVDSTKDFFKIKERAMNHVIILPTKEGTLKINTLKSSEVTTWTFVVKENV